MLYREKHWPACNELTVLGSWISCRNVFQRYTFWSDSELSYDGISGERTAFTLSIIRLGLIAHLMVHTRYMVWTKTRVRNSPRSIKFHWSINSVTEISFLKATPWLHLGSAQGSTDLYIGGLVGSEMVYSGINKIQGSTYYQYLSAQWLTSLDFRHWLTWRSSTGGWFRVKTTMCKKSP